jgi:hypothetical protein
VTGIIGALLEILSAALSIWESKEKRKYIDRKLELEKRYYEEYNKPDSVRSDAVLDNIEFELRQLARTVASEIGTTNS